MCLTVAFVTRYKPSCPTVSTLGELFMMVFTLEIGRRSSFIFTEGGCVLIVYTYYSFFILFIQKKRRTSKNRFAERSDSGSRDLKYSD